MARWVGHLHFPIPAGCVELLEPQAEDPVGESGGFQQGEQHCILAKRTFSQARVWIFLCLTVFSNSSLIAHNDHGARLALGQLASCHLLQ